jgi:hypothetical protein
MTTRMIAICGATVPSEGASAPETAIKWGEVTTAGG